VNLLANILTPFGLGLGLTKSIVLALSTPPVLLLVWFLVRRIRSRLDKDPDHEG
jgi:uncharacterized membrane-anchored protein